MQLLSLGPRSVPIHGGDDSDSHRLCALLGSVSLWPENTESVQAEEGGIWMSAWYRVNMPCKALAQNISRFYLHETSPTAQYVGLE